MKILIRRQGENRWCSLSYEEFKEEADLQKILFEDPDIIPVKDLSDADLAQVKLMLREVGLPGSGSTDLVGIDAKGNIYIIEAKLAKNPEAKRQVIGQILEYAAYMHEEGFDWLDSVVKKQKGVGLSEFFEQQDDPNWNKEVFEQNIADNLALGRFKLFIVVDKINPDLQRIINYMRNILKVEIYALELKYFKDNNAGIEILVPIVHGGKKPPPTRPPKWTWKTFRKDAENRVDEDTLKTMDQLHEFSCRIGRVDFGSGKVYGTFKLFLPYKDGKFDLYVVRSAAKGGWFGFKTMLQKGVKRELIQEFIRNLKSLGFPLDENKHVERYPQFDVTILNEKEKLLKFKQYVKELKKKLQSIS